MKTMKSVRTVLALPALALLFSGCSGQMDFGVLTPANKTQGANQTVLPGCAVSQPQVLVQGAINSFEMTDSNNIQLGFSTIKAGAPISVGIGAKITKMSLDLSLFGLDPNTRQVLAPAQVTSDQTQTNLNASIDFKGIQLGLTNYNSTPIGKVSMNALNMAVAQMVEKLNLDPSQQWFSRVQSFASSSQIIINSGSSANISVGDEFNIFNVVHTRPCLTGDQVFPSPDFPIGTAVVTSVNSTYSVASVKLKGAWVPQIGSEIRPLPGAKKLYKRSAALGGISSKPLLMSDGTSLDIQPIINNQLVSALFGSFVISQ